MKKVFNCISHFTLPIAVTTKKLLSIIPAVMLVVFSSCSSDADLLPEETLLEEETTPQLFFVYKTNEFCDLQVKDTVVFTDLDIVWFNPQTREIRFKDNEKIKSIPPYASSAVKSSSETLFVISSNICYIVNRAYDDLVLLRDYHDRFHLDDSYPEYWDPEKTQQNAEKRSAGWNKFIDILKAEGRIK